jgi:hypothetical protein
MYYVGFRVSSVFHLKTIGEIDAVAVERDHLNAPVLIQPLRASGQRLYDIRDTYLKSCHPFDGLVHNQVVKGSLSAADQHNG